MLRKLLETRTSPLPDEEFNQVMAFVTSDIKINRIGYGQQTSLAYALEVAVITHSLILKGISAA